MRRKMYFIGAITMILAGAFMAAPAFAEEIEDSYEVVTEGADDSQVDDTMVVQGENSSDPMFVPGDELGDENPDSGILTGWQEIDGNWFYYDADGVMCTGWLTLGKQTYFFDENGCMATGWIKDDGAYFYLDENGRKKTGWIQLTKGWYYLGKDGKMVTGWQQIGNKYYYFASSGLMQTGWFQNGRGWYYFDASGRMVTGWQQIKDKYYYFNTSGLMQTGWIQSKGKYYYLDANGRMLTGWQKLSGKWYLFKADGSRDLSVIDADSADYMTLFAEDRGKCGFAETDRGFLRVIRKSRIDFNNEQAETIEMLYAIEYDSGMNLMGGREIPVELEHYGGFYSGKDAYYLLFSADNENEEENKEVFRVVKYSKDWERLGAAAITGNSGFGGRVSVPFSWGTLDMLEKNGILYIACGHEGFKDDNGVRHQGLLFMCVDETELTGHISISNLWHSFSQNLAISEDGEIYMVEESEGDEATVLSWMSDDGTYHKQKVEGDYWDSYESQIIEVLKYGGKRTSSHAVLTYATSDDIQVSGSNILTVGSSIDQSRYDDDTYKKTYNIYLTVTPRNDFSEEATTVRWITKDNCNGYRSIRLLKLNENRLLLVWRQSESETSVAASDDTDTMKDSVLHYVFLDGDGKTISKIFTASGRLSDSYPIVKGGNVILTASDGSEVAFYTINGKNGDFSKKLLSYKNPNVVTWTVKDGVVTFSGHGAVDKDAVYDRYYLDFEEATTLYIEEGVTEIPEFDSLPKLSKAVIPNSVTKLDGVFIGHQSTLDVYVPASVTSIGNDAFLRAWYWGSYRDKYNVRIYCEKDSYAAKFAADKGIAYTILDTPYNLAAWRNAVLSSGEWKKGQYYDAFGKAYGSGNLSWKKNAKGWWVESSDGWYPKNEWVKIDGKWYYFDNRGYMVSNAWQDGRWLSSSGAWTYLQRGAWKCDSKGWWYDDTSGWKAKNQWQKINGNWYYFDANSYMVTGDRTINGKVYHFGSSGVCQNP